MLSASASECLPSSSLLHYPGHIETLAKATVGLPYVSESDLSRFLGSASGCRPTRLAEEHIASVDRVECASDHCGFAYEDELVSPPLHLSPV